MRATVGGGGLAAGEAAAFEAVQQAHEACALDAERLAEVGLGQARVGLDDDQHRELRGTDVEGGKRAHEVLEDPHLQAAHEVAEMPVQHAEVQHWSLLARTAPFGGLRRPNIARGWPWQLSLGHEWDLGCC